MPLFFQQNINEHTSVGIWSIEEEETFFSVSTSLPCAVTHPQKRKQHLAGRFMLKILKPDFPLHEIRIADTRKPYLPENSSHFSISHSGLYASAIVSTAYKVGVDVEMYTARVLKVLHKFLSPDELSLLDQHAEKPYTLETMLWSVKETVFKWYGLGEVDFKEHIRITRIVKTEDDGYSIYVLFKGIPLQVTGICFTEFCLTWVCS